MRDATDATLTKIQKNYILKRILEYYLPPSDFQWTEKGQEEWSNRIAAIAIGRIWTYLKFIRGRIYRSPISF